jgi:hypothetical protein
MTSLKKTLKMENILYNLYITQPSFKFNGTAEYWKGSSANQTIKFRNDVNTNIINQGFTLPIKKQILKWGGIHGFKQYPFVDQAISDLEENNNISSETANAISSYSKLFGFYKPKDYFILDARVCYVYNKLIILYNIENLTPVKFDINRSRNRNLKENYKEMITTWTGDFISVTDFYPKYCDMIKNLHQYFISQNKDIFNINDFINNDAEIIEMFLFFLADYI